MKSLAEQLSAAFKAKGWTLEKLSVESGLDCSRWSLMRKLRGDQRLFTDECQALAQALGVTIAWAPAESKRRASP